MSAVEGTVLVIDRRTPQNGTQRLPEDQYDEAIHELAPEPDE